MGILKVAQALGPDRAAGLGFRFRIPAGRFAPGLEQIVFREPTNTDPKVLLWGLLLERAHIDAPWGLVFGIIKVITKVRVIT